MPAAGVPINEQRRIAALRESGLLDSEPEVAFDDLTALAARVCKVPTALVSLVDSDRQWFKSKVGLCETQTSRSSAICAHAILSDEVLIIPDASIDPRTFDNPLVTGELHVRFYAGVPLVTSDGLALGTLCVFDYRPRTLTREQIESLKMIGRQVVALLEARRAAGRLKADRGRAASGWNSVTLGAAAVLAIGFAVTVAVSMRGREAVRHEARSRFERLNDRVTTEVERRAKLPVYGMHGARGVFAASQSVERLEFGAYVASRDLTREFPGVLGFGFLKRVEEKDESSFVAAVRGDNGEGFRIHPEREIGSGASRWVVKYVEPTEPNKGYWGLDLSTVPGCMEAIEEAVRSGLPRMSPRMRIHSGNKPVDGHLYFVPVYHGEAGTSGAGAGSLNGVLFTLLDVNKAVEGVEEVADGMIRFEVLPGTGGLDGGANGGAVSGKVLDDKTSGSERAGLALRGPGEGSYEASTNLLVSGCPWTIRAWSTPKFEASVSFATPMAEAAGGTALTVTLAALVYSLGWARARALRIASRMAREYRQAAEQATAASRELRSLTATLAVEHERLDMILAGTGLGSWDWNVQTSEVRYDERWAAILGEIELPPPHLDEWAKRVHPEDKDRALAQIEEHFAGRAPLFECLIRMRHVDGSWRWILDRGLLVERDADGRPLRMVGTHQDVTEQKKEQDVVAFANAMLRRTGSMARVGGWELQRETRELYWSDELYRIHELDPGTPVTTEMAIGFYAPEARAEIRAAVERGIATGEPWDLELPLVTAKGRSIWVRAQGEAIREGDRVIKLSGAFQDITDRRLAEDALRQAATHDKLTGLPNRATLHDRLSAAIHRADRAPGKLFALLFLDFDRFKLINDSLGHEAGMNFSEASRSDCGRHFG